MYSELNETIRERLREIRKRHGITQAQLAKMMHRTKSSISQYESGRFQVNTSYIEEFARVIGMNPYQILRFDEPPKNTAIIEEWHGHMMVVIPEYFATIFGLEEGSIVEIVNVKGGLLIKPIPDMTDGNGE